MTNKKLLLLVTLLGICTVAIAQGDNACIAFNKLYSQIRDQKIERRDASQQMATLKGDIDAYYKFHHPAQPSTQWVFPLKGYTAAAIGGKNGNGYIASGYNFMEGNKHGGHPAHDIFIQDANQDCIDDKRKNVVEVLSASDGVVLATENNWQPGSEQRGGNYILIYSPSEGRLFYYAHNKTVMVKPGDIVAAGKAIATVGRSGANAYKQRSPTHLHFMVLQLNNGMPVPENPYEMLKKARVI